MIWAERNEAFVRIVQEVIGADTDGKAGAETLRKWEDFLSREKIKPPPPPPDWRGWYWMSRQEWVSDPGLPRLGNLVPRTERVGVMIHHTVTVDRDATPNAWEQDSDIREHMRRLQKIRPDLGLDVPYNVVAFCQPSRLVICEGRGLDRTGAHASGFNRSHLGIAFAGNFEERDPPENLRSHLLALAAWLRDLRDLSGYTLLGTRRLSATRTLWAHRDIKATACPGRHLFGLLEGISI